MNGKDFDVAAFLGLTQLKNAYAHYKGTSLPKGGKLKHSGFSIKLSNADFHELDKQIRDSTLFLKKHRRQLSLLKQSAGVDEAYLSFATQQRDEIAHFDYFPAELLALAGKLGIGIQLCRFRISHDNSEQMESGPKTKAIRARR